MNKLWFANTPKAFQSSINAEGVSCQLSVTLNALALSSALTPKALANLSPGLERSDNPGFTQKKRGSTLKGFVAEQTLSGLKPSLNLLPGLERKQQPWVYIKKRGSTLKVAEQTLSGLKPGFEFTPKVVAALQPWAEISQRLWRIFQFHNPMKT